MKNEAFEQMVRLELRIIKLGGTIPQPWPWAIWKTVVRKGKQKHLVNLPMYNLQLLETVEDLERGNRSPSPA